MSKNKMFLLMLAKGGMSQVETAAIVHVSKRQVSAAAKAVREFDLTYDAVASMDEDVIDDMFFQKEELAQKRRLSCPRHRRLHRTQERIFKARSF